MSSSSLDHYRSPVDDPHSIPALLRPPTIQATQQHVLQRLNFTLPQLAAQHPSRPLSALPTSAALKAHLAQLQESQRLAQQHASGAEANLRRQLTASLTAVKALKQRLESLPDSIASTEDQLLDLCEQLVSNAASSSAAGAPAAESSRRTSKTLLERLKQLHGAINQLKRAKAYFGLLAKAEDLRLAIEKSESGAAAAGSSSIDATPTPLSLLAELHHHVQACESLSEGPATRLKAIDFLQAQRDAAFTHLRKSRITRLQEALSASDWPPQAPSRHAERDGDDYTTDGATSAESIFAKSAGVRAAWSDLCELQDEAERLSLIPRATAKPPPSAKSVATKARRAVPAGSDDYVPLLATQVIIEPLLLRFRYHFDGSRPTNRLDKPEWYLSHIASLIDSQASVFQPPVRGVPGSGGPIARLCRFYANAKPDDKGRKAFRYIDTYAELLHGLLTPLRRKLASSMPSLVEHPSLLAHTVFQALTFDADLRERFPASRAVLGHAGTAKLADDILANQEWFTRWLDGEKEFALQRFDEIMDAPDAWAIGSSDSIAEDSDQIFPVPGSGANGDDAGGSAERTSKTTKSARAVVEILESVTERYRPLPSLEQRLSFLAIVQLPILRAYHQRLQRSLDAFESLSSAFARAMPGEISAGIGAAAGVSTGTSDSDMVRGLRGLGRLIKAMLSASFLCSELERWSETALFVEMSEDLQSTEAGQKLALGLKRDEGAEQDRELDAASLGMLLRRGLKRGAAAARPLAAGSVDSTGGSGANSTPAGDLASTGGQLLTDFGKWGVWEEPRRKLGEVVQRATLGVERLVVSEVLEQLRPYAHRNWNSNDATGDGGKPQSTINDVGDWQAEGADEGGADEEDEAIPTPSLIPSLSILSTHLSHLVTILEPEKTVPVYRHIASSISNAVVERVVMAGGSHRFTYRSALRFRSDFERGWLHVVSSIPATTAGSFGRNPVAPWKPLRDTATLLSLPSSTGSTENAAVAEGGWTLAKATRALFEEDDGLAQLEQDLGLDFEVISVARCREVLRRRVDCWR